MSDTKEENLETVVTGGDAAPDTPTESLPMANAVLGSVATSTPVPVSSGARPKTGAPKTGVPGTSVPGTSASDTSAPGTSAPGASGSGSGTGAPRTRPAPSKLVGANILRPDFGRGAESRFGSNIVVGQTRLGTSVVTDVIGEGGMATVYKVWNEGLEVYRAVKLLSHEASSARFETEAKIIAKLHHEGIVEVYNIGVWNGVPFMEMEIIDGSDLQQALTERGRLPEIVCAAIAVVVSEALAHAHTQTFTLVGKQYRGIIHRDLKPANIMISKEGKVKLTDFGIARPAQASIHTVEGGIVGTLHYLAPEQMDGGKVDNRSDIYSFGTILYEMLTGERTFPQEAIAELVLQKSLNKFKPIEEYDIEINPELVKIINRCLAYSPEDRYQRTQELVSDLRKVYATMTERPPKDVVEEYFGEPADPETVAAVAEARAAEDNADGGKPKWAMDTGTRDLPPSGGNDTRVFGGDGQTPKKSKLHYIAAAAVLVSIIPLAIIISSNNKDKGIDETAAEVVMNDDGSDGRDTDQGGDSQTYAAPQESQEPQSADASETVAAQGAAGDDRSTVAKSQPAPANRPTKKEQTARERQAAAAKAKQSAPAKTAQAAQPAPAQTATPAPAPAQPAPAAQPAAPAAAQQTAAAASAAGNETELLREAQQAANQRQWGRVIEILEPERSFPTQRAQRTLHLFNAYVEGLQLNKAQAMMDTTSLTQDAYFLLCAGKFWRYRGRPDMAIKYFEAAIAGRSIVGTRNLLPDVALYYIAELRHDRWVESPTAPNRAAALAAWNKVSDVMLSKPNNPMMRRAVREIAVLSGE